jgi:hypothetical protein
VDSVRHALALLVAVLWLTIGRYLMLIESDGRNDPYLIVNDYAARFVQTIMGVRDRLPRNHPEHWFTDTSVAALCAWILWFTRGKGRTRFMSPKVTC